MIGLSTLYFYITFINSFFSIELCFTYINLWFIYYMGMVIFFLLFVLSRRLFSYLKLLFSLYIYIYIYLFVCILVLSNDIVSFIIAFESLFFPVSFISLFYTFSNRFIFAIYILIIVSSFSSILCILVISIILLHFNIIYINLFLDFATFDNIYFGIIIWLFFFLIFGIKYPIWPLHAWLPEIHVEVSTELSVLLASVILKIGFFGVYKYLFMSYIFISIWLINLIIVLLMIGLSFIIIKLMTLCDYKKVIAHWSVIHTCLGLILVWHNDTLYVGLLIFCNLGHILSSSCMFLILGIIYDSYGLRVFLVLTSYFGSNLWSTVFLLIFLFNIDAPFTMLFFIDLLLLLGLINFTLIYVYTIFIINMGVILSSLYVYLCISYFSFLWNNKYYRFDISINDIHLFSNIMINVMVIFYLIYVIF